MRSWKAEVVADSTGKWNGNALRFATQDEAAAYAKDLMSRWTSVQLWRVLETDEPASHRWTGHKSEPVKDV